MRSVVLTNPEQRAAVEGEYERAREAGRTVLSAFDWQEGWLAQGAVVGVHAVMRGQRSCRATIAQRTRSTLGPGQRPTVGLSQPTQRPRRLRLVPSRVHALRSAAGDRADFWTSQPGMVHRFVGRRSSGAAGFWWALATEANDVRSDFTDPNLSTRFLGYSTRTCQSMPKGRSRCCRPGVR